MPLVHIEQDRTEGRRPSVTCRVGGVSVGAAHPVVVQSMTNSDTEDPAATAEQIRLLAEAGSELVRITVNTRKAAAAVSEIRRRLDDAGVTAPVVGDFHYNGHLLLTEYPDCARALDKYRINPGNVGVGAQHDDNFRRMIEVAVDHGKPVRIGVNWGSLEAMRESALRSAELAESFGQPHDAIILSAKVSEVRDLIDVYRDIAGRCDYPLHLGLTEAGIGHKGVVATTAALSVLLYEGIGDTIRTSLTPSPGGDRADEVRVCQQILQSLGIRHFTPQVSSCPGCGRTTSTYFQELAADITAHLQQRMAHWRTRLPGVEELRVAVMGCIVNGPGESKHADIGISLPGTGENPSAPVYVDGQLKVTLKGDRIAEDFTRILDEYVEARYGTAETAEGAKT